VIGLYENENSCSDIKNFSFLAKMDSSLDLPRRATSAIPLVGSIYAKTRSYIAFVWLGLGTLLPFNFFITAGSYFCKQLKDPTLSNTSIHLELLYENTVTLCASFTNLLTVILVTFIFVPYIHKYRIYTSLIVIIICFCISLATALPSDKTWRGIFFAVTMILVMIQSVCSAILLNCFFSLASTLPSRYIQGKI
jgi:equilibrative nucleoside transporter 1/2/3